MSTKKKPTKSKSAAARTKARPVKVKKGAWFVAVRWSYLPVSPQGWALYIPYVAYLVLVMVVAAYADTVAEAVLIIIPSFVAGAIVMQWVAAHKS